MSSETPTAPSSRADTASTAPDGTSAGGATLRRRVVLTGAGAAAIGAVAACSSPSYGPASGGTTTAADAPEGAPGTVLGPASQIPVGGGTVFADQQVVVTQPAPGRFQGLSTVCPHQGCQVNSVRDGAVVCPCHGSRFGLDGAVLEGPAQSPLARRAVTVKGQDVTLA